MTETGRIQTEITIRQISLIFSDFTTRSECEHKANPAKIMHFITKNYVPKPHG